MQADIIYYLDRLEEEVKKGKIDFFQLKKQLLLFIDFYKYKRSHYCMQFPELSRARCQAFASIGDACKEFGHVDRLSFLKDSEVKNQGRCNTAGKSVFYCSDENGVPVFEVRPNNGDYLVVTRFIHRQKPDIELFFPVIGVREITENVQVGLLPKILKKDIQFRDAPENLIIDDYFASWFMEPSQVYYKLTSELYAIFTNHITTEGKKVSCLVYPSIGSRISGVNLALEPSFVQENLKVDSAIIYQVINYDSNTAKTELKPLQESFQIDKTGNLVWKAFADHCPHLYLDPRIPPTEFEKYFRV